MTAITNNQRVEWAEAAVQRYIEATLLYDEPATVLTALLCDLMHYAKRQAIDIDRAYIIATGHFQDQEMERVIETMKKARDELRFLQHAGARGANDTQIRKALRALDQAIAKAEGDAP